MTVSDKKIVFTEKDHVLKSVLTEESWDQEVFNATTSGMHPILYVSGRGGFKCLKTDSCPAVKYFKELSTDKMYLAAAPRGYFRSTPKPIMTNYEVMCSSVNTMTNGILKLIGKNKEKLLTASYDEAVELVASYLEDEYSYIKEKGRKACSKHIV